MTDSNSIIKNVVGAIVGIKVLETGMKLVDRNKTKIKGGLLDVKTKKKKGFI